MNINDILETLGVKSLILAGLTMTVSGVIGFWIKDFPKQILNWIKRNFITSMEIDSTKHDFHVLLTFIQNKYENKKFRTYKIFNKSIMNEIDDNDDTIHSASILTIGYGYHFIRYKNSILYLSLVKDTDNHTVNEKLYIRISKLGRSKKIFDDLLNSSYKYWSDLNNDSNYITISDVTYTSSSVIMKRSLDTIFLSKNVKETVVNGIRNFINKRSWYIKHGIPYHMGILLYGPPGTGKTSFIHALASEFNKDIITIPASKVCDLSKNNSRNSIIVIEDIDSNSIVKNRDDKKKSDDISLLDKLSENASGIGLSELLNSMDGLNSQPGTILICTTNHIEDIDPAVIRPGRIDICQEISSMDRDSINDFLMSFFGKPLPDDIEIKSDIFCSKLQNMILMKNTYDEIVDYVKA